MGNAPSDIHVVIIGAGYGGISAAKYLDSRCKVTLIEPSDAFNHKIAALRGVVVPGWERRTRIPLNKLLKKGKVLQSAVESVSTGRVTLADHTVIECDYVILAHGRGKSDFPCDATDDATTSEQVFAKMRGKQKVIAQARSILIVGGGPVGVELAGEIAAAHADKKITLVTSANRLLSNSAVPIIDKAVEKISKKLAAMHVEVKLNTRVKDLPAIKGGDAFLHNEQLSSTTYALDDGTSVEADLAIVCTGGVRRVGNLVDAVDQHNQVMVEADLQVVGLPKVYCIGDANNVVETKMAYFAAKQAVLAAQNIEKLHALKATTPYVPMDGNNEYGVMFVPLGPKKGVGALGGTVMGDGLVSLIKGKGLFVNKTYADFNVAVPNL